MATLSAQDLQGSAQPSGCACAQLTPARPPPCGQSCCPILQAVLAVLSCWPQSGCHGQGPRPLWRGGGRAWCPLGYVPRSPTQLPSAQGWWGMLSQKGCGSSIVHHRGKRIKTQAPERSLSAQRVCLLGWNGVPSASFLSLWASPHPQAGCLHGAHRACAGGVCSLPSLLSGEMPPACTSWAPSLLDLLPIL